MYFWGFHRGIPKFLGGGLSLIASSLLLLLQQGPPRLFLEEACSSFFHAQGLDYETDLILRGYFHMLHLILQFVSLNEIIYNRGLSMMRCTCQH